MKKQLVGDGGLRRIFRGGVYGSHLKVQLQPSHRRSRNPLSIRYVGKFFGFRIVRNKPSEKQ